jgi:hypothetical protein
MKAKRKKLTAATLSAFLALAGAIQAQDTGGDKVKTGKKATKVRSHKGGHNRRFRRSGKKSGSTVNTPAPK